MKRCANCFENNANGATHCVVCCEPLPAEPTEDIKPEEPKQEVIAAEQPKVEEPATPTVDEPTPEPPFEEPEEVKEDPVSEPPTPQEPIQAALEVYHDSEPKVVYTHLIVNDITKIGREDPQRDVFPDVDITKLESLGVSAKSVSREHLRILREDNKFYLFIYHGSTGTQVNKSVIDSGAYGKKFEISIGDRIILGGKVRLKLVAC